MSPEDILDEKFDLQHPEEKKPNFVILTEYSG
jgi:hypothetical protein